MYQGPNFNHGDGKILPARKSFIWCPTENLTGFDLAPGDRVLFFKTSGIATQDLQREFQKENSIDERWALKEIYVAEIKSKIFSRNEFTFHNHLSESEKLWKNDPKISDDWRWNRVFEFRCIKIMNSQTKMSELYANTQSKQFVLKALEAFCYGKSRELSLEEYRNLLEALI